MNVPAAHRMISAAIVFFRKHVYQETGWDHQILKPAVVVVCNIITVNAQVFLKNGVHIHITLAQAEVQNRTNFANANSFTQANFDRCNVYSKCHRVHTVCHFLPMLLSFTEFRIQTTATVQWIKLSSPVIDFLSI